MKIHLRSHRQDQADHSSSPNLQRAIAEKRMSCCGVVAVDLTDDETKVTCRECREWIHTQRIPSGDGLALAGGVSLAKSVSATSEAIKVLGQAKRFTCTDNSGLPENVVRRWVFFCFDQEAETRSVYTLTVDSTSPEASAAFVLEHIKAKMKSPVVMGCVELGTLKMIINELGEVPATLTVTNSRGLF